MIGYSIKDWKAKFYPNGNHINLNDFTKIPDDLVICDVCNKDIRQPEDDAGQKVVWNYDDSEKGMWSICTECKEHPERLDKSFRLFENTEKEMVKMMEPCLRESSKKMIDDYGLEGYIKAIEYAIKGGYLKKNEKGQLTVTDKSIAQGSGFVIMPKEKILDGQGRL